MKAYGTTPLSAIGFFTVVENPDHGLIGGYLLLNSAARPLEFHCTAPVKANRAQEILYGPTLAPFLYGDQIGAALLNKGETAALFVCTDVAAALAVRDHVELPVALVWNDEIEAPIPARLALREFQLENHRLAVRGDRPDDQLAIEQAWRMHAANFDLLEPFSRIREAIGEAQQTACP